MSTRSPPSLALSVGVSSSVMTNLRSSTRVSAEENAIPPLWEIVPVSAAGCSVPPVIGKLSAPSSRAVAGPIGLTDTPSEVSAAAVPGSRAREVAPPVTAMSAGRALIATVPTGVPPRNRDTENVAFSALAASRVSDACTPPTVVAAPSRPIAAPERSSLRNGTWASPTVAVSRPRAPSAWTT